MIHAAAATEIPYSFVAIKLLCAVCAGGLIGLERALHGRPTGFRTHSIVCLASAALVQVVVHLPIWLAGAPSDTFGTDATRVMQGIMSGMGFLGAGVIFREGLTIRGLTTAASIWITAPIGILFGVGFFYIGALTTLIVIIILTLFRQIESLIHSRTYAHCDVTFARNGNIQEEDFLKLLAEHKLEMIGNMNHQLINGGQDCEFSMTIRSANPESFAKLSKILREKHEYKTFSIEFIRD